MQYKQIGADRFERCDIWPDFPFSDEVERGDSIADRIVFGVCLVVLCAVIYLGG